MQPGDTIDGRFVLKRLIGRGAHADVFEAHDHQSGQPVALKVLHRAIAGDEQARHRFEREARAQGTVRHPNVAQLLGSGMTSEGEPYLVVELLRGYSLRDVVQSYQRVEVIRGCSYIWQALQGLSAAHQSGILHRDLKPANLMLEPSQGPVERVCVIDFGFASFENSTTRVTREGEVVGSLSYMAPERLTGGSATERSDLYSLACILYEILVGQRPFIAKSDYLLITAQVQNPPMPPTFANPEADIPLEVESVILRGLAKNPEDRPASALAMADELETAAQYYVGRSPHGGAR